LLKRVILGVMPRHARLELPGTPLHITQRGVNRCAIFLDDDDRCHFLRLLRERAAISEVAIHAYVMMGNHVQLLATAARAGAGAVARMMHGVCMCYVQTFNRRHGRTGTLWEGRYKSCLVDSERYLLTVYRYIELNPVRAAMVDLPEHYRWSSVQANLNLRRSVGDATYRVSRNRSDVGRTSEGLSTLVGRRNKFRRSVRHPTSSAATTRSGRPALSGHDRTHLESPPQTAVRAAGREVTLEQEAVRSDSCGKLTAHIPFSQSVDICSPRATVMTCAL
jgi:REP element-mobilizing transposase RayT